MGFVVLATSTVLVPSTFLKSVHQREASPAHDIIELDQPIGPFEDEHECEKGKRAREKVERCGRQRGHNVVSQVRHGCILGRGSVAGYRGSTTHPADVLDACLRWMEVDTRF